MSRFTMDVEGSNLAPPDDQGTLTMRDAASHEDAYARRLISSAWEIARHVADTDVSDEVIAAGEWFRDAFEEGSLEPGQLEQFDAWMSGIAATGGLLDKITSSGKATVNKMAAAGKALTAQDFQDHARDAGEAAVVFQAASLYATGLSGFDRDVVTAWAGHIDSMYINNDHSYSFWIPAPNQFHAVRADLEARKGLVSCKWIAQQVTMTCYRFIDDDRCRARLAKAA